MRQWWVALAFAAVLEPGGSAFAGRLDELPLVVDPPAHAQPRGAAVFISGDGGWAKIDTEFSAELLAAGYGVVGLNANRYFSSRKTPDQIAADIGLIGRHYTKEWGTDRLLLVGYSRGAEVLPFVEPRLDADLRRQVESLVMIGPAPYTHFVIHLTDYISSKRRPESVDVLPEAEKVDRPMICVYGSGEGESLCPLLPDSVAKIEVGGGHHFNGDYRAIAKRVLEIISAPPFGPVISESQ